MAKKPTAINEQSRKLALLNYRRSNLLAQRSAVAAELRIVNDEIRAAAHRTDETNLTSETK